MNTNKTKTNELKGMTTTDCYPNVIPLIPHTQISFSIRVYLCASVVPKNFLLTCRTGSL